MTTQAVDKPTASVPTVPERPRETPVFVPPVDIKESEAAVTLVADMPGVDEKNVHVDLDKNVLTIRGTFADRAPNVGCSLTYQEYRSGDYERSFTLGDTIDRAGIRATAKDGV